MTFHLQQQQYRSQCWYDSRVRTARAGAATSITKFQHNAITPAGEHVTRFYIYLDYSKVGTMKLKSEEQKLKRGADQCSARIHGEHPLEGKISSQEPLQEIGCRV